MTEILDLSFKKKINCSKDVAWWNYWDHEHLDVVHNGYQRSDIMYDKNNFLFRVDKIKVPFIPIINFNTSIFMVQHDDDTLFTYATQFGVNSKTTITIHSISENSCEIKMNYKFYLEGWRVILKPLLKKLIPKWNETVWLEDYNIKLRRQKVLDMGFKDFVGLPAKIKDRKKSPNSFKIKLPIPRPKKSSRDMHPLSFRH
jgi:hypothetical protein